MSEPIFRTRSLTKHFGGLKAVQDVSMEIARGEIVALIGPNGAGKTTCFNLVTCVEQPTSGDVEFEGRSIVGWPAWRVAQSGIGRTFQNIRLFKEMTVLDNIKTTHTFHVRYGLLAAVTHGGAFGDEERALDAKARGFLDLMDMSDCCDQKARELPYGEQRKLEIARALAVEPRLLLLDEPAAGMNPTEKVALSALVRRLRDEFDLTILLIDHDMRFVMGLSNRIYVLDHGEPIASGSPEQVRSDPRVVAAYLGCAPAPGGASAEGGADA